MAGENLLRPAFQDGTTKVKTPALRCGKDRASYIVPRNRAPHRRPSSSSLIVERSFADDYADDGADEIADEIADDQRVRDLLRNVAQVLDLRSPVLKGGT